MAICSCGSPARCCQPAVVGGFIYADLRGELNTHLAPQALFTQSSPGRDATATSFPLSKHTGGGDTAPTLSGRRGYLQFTWEVGLPPSPVEFFSHCHFYKLSCSWLLGMCRCSSLLQPGCEGFPLPPLQCSGCPTLYSTFFCCYCLLFSFSFCPGWGSVFPGGYADLAQGCLWKYCVQVSSPCGPHIPKPSGRWHLVVAREPSWFLHLT
jgi:hypothetical protein